MHILSYNGSNIISCIGVRKNMALWDIPLTESVFKTVQDTERGSRYRKKTTGGQYIRSSGEHVRPYAEYATT